MEIFMYKSEQQKEYVATWTKIQDTETLTEQVQTETMAANVPNDSSTNDSEATTKKQESNSFDSKNAEVKDFVGSFKSQNSKIVITQDNSVANTIVVNITCYQKDNNSSDIYLIPVIIDQQIPIDTTQKLKDMKLEFADANQYYGYVTLQKISDSQMVVTTAKDNEYYPIAGTNERETVGIIDPKAQFEKKPVSSTTSSVWSVYNHFTCATHYGHGQLNITKMYPDGFDFSITKEDETLGIEGKAYFYSDEVAFYKENGYDVEISRNEYGVVGVLDNNDKSSGVAGTYSIVTE